VEPEADMPLESKRLLVRSRADRKEAWTLQLAAEILEAEGQILKVREDAAKNESVLGGHTKRPGRYLCRVAFRSGFGGVQ
jgi:hypothetical protein